MLCLLFDQGSALRAPRRFDGGDLDVPFPGPRLELYQPGEAGTQHADELGLRAGNIAVVMQLARDTAGLLAREQKFQCALLSIEITQREQPPEAFPARGYFRLERLAAPQQLIEVALRRCAFARQSAKRPAGFGYRALGVPQLVARFRTAFFGLRDFRAQLFDTPSEGIELFRFALGERQDGRNEERHPDPADRVRDAGAARRYHPVLSPRGDRLALRRRINFSPWPGRQPPGPALPPRPDLQDSNAVSAAIPSPARRPAESPWGCSRPLFRCRSRRRGT